MGSYTRCLGCEHTSLGMEILRLLVALVLFGVCTWFFEKTKLPDWAKKVVRTVLIITYFLVVWYIGY